LLAHKLLGANIDNTPLAGRVHELPAWLERDVLTRWADPRALDQVVHPSIRRLWREPSRWQAAVRARIPNRFAATLEYQASLDEPLLARYQFMYLVRSVRAFARRNMGSKSVLES
jgi:hypothetical protein